MKISLKKSAQKITLTQNDYIAGGGEGKVYGKGSSAFKVYHDTSKMIPIGKINELSLLSPKNVLVPRDIVLDLSGKPIGFQMDLIPESIFLAWMFNKGWKQTNSITPDIILHITKVMRETTITLHNESCIVGDYNEMQFLVAKDYSNVFFVDTDSYQTTSFPCTAIMDTVRDRTVPFGTFTSGTDWFAYAVVTFQLWTGVHPYMCKHPNYSRKDVKSFKMMEDNISAYSKGVDLPRQALPLSVIPSKLDRWYREVFENKDRSTPPIPDSAVPAAVPKMKVISSNESFKSREIASAPSTIRKVSIINGKIYIITDNEIISNDKVLTRISKNKEYFLCECSDSYNPIVVKYDGVRATFHDLSNGKEIDSCEVSFCTTHRGRLYTILDGTLYNREFKSLMGNIFHEYEIAEHLYGIKNITAFNGVVYQDVLGVPWFALLDEHTSNIQVEALKDRRILDCSYNSCLYNKQKIGILIVISEKNGKYYKSIFNISTRVELTIEEECTPGDQANFTLLDNGIAVYVDENELVLRMFGLGAKKIQNPPFDNSSRLCTDGSRVMVVNGNKLVHVSMV